MAFVFANSNSNLVAYLASITGGTHILNTKLQREFTKSYKWKSDMIFYMMWVGEVPGKIYFHPVEKEDGVIIQESLDGKSRTSAPDEFMRGTFKLDDEFKVKGFERLYGKYYHEFTAADQALVEFNCAIDSSCSSFVNQSTVEFMRMSHAKRSTVNCVCRA